ncbi:MAG: histidine--tRNA ligase [Candidatus Omnitrophica bacterium]|nr:histidine--tRNA ligase [Candidatus Omnitrophota bacterium]
MQIKALRGTTDLLPPAVAHWQFVEKQARDMFRIYGFKEIRTPLLEETLLFTRAIGETTDLVEKQMYSFTDRGERNITLRPEGTAPIIRAYLEHHLDLKPGLARLFYVGPMFRAERPQAGRSRQFHQIGAEVIGSYEAQVDAEALSLLRHFFERVSLSGYTVHLNSLGCSKDKKEIGLTLQKTLEKNKDALCAECQERLHRNVYRILDCKKKECRKAVETLPSLLEKLCPDCTTHFETLKQYLTHSKVPFVIAPHLVRGLDYYTRTAFEITHPLLGAQDAVGAGGRYDGLVEELGGEPTGAFGFSIGFERLLLALEAQKISFEEESPLEIYIIPVGENLLKIAYEILHSLRKAGISSLLDFEKKSLKAQMRLANHLKARRVLLIGEDEVREKRVTLKEMGSGKERKVSQDRLVEELLKEIGKEKR